jgi:DNA-binding response OmpR family regulator
MSPAPVSKKILWMDGEIEFLRAHIAFLEANGFEVEKSSSLAAALDLLRTCPYDLVLLDEQSLGKEGASTLGRIRAACSAQVPLLLVTKNDEERAASSNWGKDMDGFVGKPVNPRQLLASCRAVLLSRADRGDAATAAYVRSREEIKSDLLAAPSPAKWEKIHFKISKWDLELAASSDNALRETHKTHKRDLSRRFLSYVEDHYAGWVGRQGGNPDLHTQTVGRKLLPLLQRRAPAALVVVSGLRFDQWIALQKQFETVFRVENAAAWALLPTEADFCRAALFSGSLPRDVGLDHPTLWERLRAGDDPVPCYRELLKVQLRKLRVDLEDPRFVHVRTAADCATLHETLEANAEAPLLVVLVEFMELMKPCTDLVSGPPEAGRSEADVRAAALELFRTSGLATALQGLAMRKRAIVLTADHGTVRADTPAEVFCQEEQSSHPRVKIGPNISCDERQALFVEAPERYGLPAESSETAYAIAKGRFYFVYPNKFQYFVTPYKDQMVSGGISLEEIIVPLATLTPLPSLEGRVEKK